LHCANHQGVPGIGVCVDCKKVVCEPCTTRLQGRNFCASCLSIRVTPESTDEGPDSTLARVAVLALGAASVALLWAVGTGLGFLLYLVG
jgi:hypothetical protein